MTAEPGALDRGGGTPRDVGDAVAGRRKQLDRVRRREVLGGAVPHCRERARPRVVCGARRVRRGTRFAGRHWPAAHGAARALGVTGVVARNGAGGFPRLGDVGDGTLHRGAVIRGTREGHLRLHGHKGPVH